MKTNKIFIYVIVILLIIAITALTTWYFVKGNKPLSSNNNSQTENNFPNGNTNEVTLPTTGNNVIQATNSDTTLRFINEYTTEFYTADKNLLIMFGSWCSHCKEELKDVEKIVSYYKDNKNVKVILIAHEYQDTISDLTKLVEQDFDFGDMQIFIDLKRIIRKTIDPEASTVPISYVVDKNGKILVKNNGAITLDIAKDMLK